MYDSWIKSPLDASKLRSQVNTFIGSGVLVSYTAQKKIQSKLKAIKSSEDATALITRLVKNFEEEFADEIKSRAKRLL